MGWVPLERPAEVERALDACADDPRFVGVRHLVNVEPDPDWILRPDVLQGLQILATRGLAFDYVGKLPRHLEHVPLFARRVPDLLIAIDHLGEPPIAAGDWEPWTLCFHVGNKRLGVWQHWIDQSRALMVTHLSFCEKKDNWPAGAIANRVQLGVQPAFRAADETG